MEALAAMGANALPHASRVAHLVANNGDDTEPRLRQLAAAALGRMGPKAKRHAWVYTASPPTIGSHA
eukprot:2410791-Pyramimonas_sp.AAC.1